MPVLVEDSPTPVLATGTAVRPVILREGISWTGGTAKSALRLQLTFANPASRPSDPTMARVEVAPFGAFVPWRPLARVSVPGLPPGGSRVVTATADGDARLPRAPLGIPSLVKSLLFESANHSVHFVGNLNVFVSRSAPVERHMNHAIGLRSGHRNIAFFCVGDGTPEAYSFSIGRCEPGWEMELTGVEWEVPVHLSTTMIGLGITPRRGADSGGASVIVERHSTGQKVPVEFEMEAAASAKCYVL